MKTFFTAVLLLSSFSIYANDIFVIKKNMNPKNVLHYKANVQNCKLKTPPVTPYWVMGEEDGHTEDLLEKEKPYFKPKISYAKDSEADFSIGAMEKMGSKIPDQSIRVRLENCKAKAFIEFKGQEIQLTEIEANVNFLISVRYMIISGIRPDGTKITHKIEN